MIASTLLRTWLVKRHKDMLVDFLNALGIKHEDGVVVKDLAVEFSPRPARYLRMRVTAPVMCPDWHKGAGNRSFVFADEFVFE